MSATIDQRPPTHDRGCSEFVVVADAATSVSLRHLILANQGFAIIQNPRWSSQLRCPSREWTTGTGLRFEAFFGEVRKLSVCSRDRTVYRHPAPENARIVNRAASFGFSLCGRVIRCRCLLLANATSREETTPISRAMRRAPRAPDWEQGVGLYIAF